MRTSCGSRHGRRAVLRHLGHRLEAVGAVAPIVEVRLGHIAFVARLEDLVEANDAIRLRIRQGFDQHAVDHTEHRRGRADAEAEGQDRGDGKRGHARQRAQAKPHVPEKVANHGVSGHAVFF